MNDATVSHMYNCLLWAFWLSLPSSFTTDRGWHTIWRFLMSGLPVFSNVASVADAAMIVLGDIISNDLTNTFIIPQDVSDLRLFKQLPSVTSFSDIGALYISIESQQKSLAWVLKPLVDTEEAQVNISDDEILNYAFTVWNGFGQSCASFHVIFQEEALNFVRGDLRDSSHLRQNLLRAVLALVNWQDCPMLNEGLVRILPAAVYALCVGCAPLPLDCKQLFPYHSSMDVLVEECIKAVFVMCVISAIDPSQRDLVVAALDNLSRVFKTAPVY
ncbi:hypothetical protein RHSIM_Rhsim02G0102600 [Rhododendron simsii]|uniref:Uncharacterized protein n=1 Tax=Rhododendron simsii TaxID=118357 RepID=A0A834HC74_RHOSS|nr:hypothetical protein RHSIM_Rhsim02G0102600 [Rhododendron simsii]